MHRLLSSTSAAVAFAACLVVLATCTGPRATTTREASAPVVPAVRAADFVFGQQGIPVQETDEWGGLLRSGLFDPRERWGGLAEARVTCGVDAAGVDVVLNARVIEIELGVDARQSASLEGPTEITVWGTGKAEVDGQRRDCSLVREYRDELVQAIAQRAEATAVRF